MLGTPVAVILIEGTGVNVAVAVVMLCVFVEGAIVAVDEIVVFGCVVVVGLAE